MSNFYSWIYVDTQNNIWKFYKNDNYELCYQVMFDDGKWTKERIVDKNILEVFIYVEDEIIHILYITLKNTIRYCTMKDNQWLGRTVYSVDDNNLELNNLKVEIIGPEMHIFFIVIEKMIRVRAVLMHCIWNSEDINTNKLQDIALNYHLEENYLIKVDDKGALTLLFITDEGEEFGVNYSVYKNHIWSQENRLYSIKGENISFEILTTEQTIHIINKYKDNSSYFMDYVSFDNNGGLQEIKIYESSMLIVDPIVVKTSSLFYVFWLENNRIFYSSYNGNYWSKSVLCYASKDKNVQKYHIYSSSPKDALVREVYCTGDLDFQILYPEQLIATLADVEEKESQVKAAELTIHKKNDSMQNQKQELIRIKSENKELSKRISSLNMQLQKNRRIAEEQEMLLNKALEQKIKAEENSKLFFKLQKQLQTELEKVNQQLNLEKQERFVSDNKYKTNSESISKVTQELQKLQLDGNSLRDEIDSLRRENEILKNENDNLNSINSSIISEKEILLQEIEDRKNKSLLHKFKKGKSNEIRT